MVSVSGSVWYLALLTCGLNPFHTILITYAEIRLATCSTKTNVWLHRAGELPLEPRANLKPTRAKVLKHVDKESDFSKGLNMKSIDGRATIPKGGGEIREDLDGVIRQVPQDGISPGAKKGIHRSIDGKKYNSSAEVHAINTSINHTKIEDKIGDTTLTRRKRSATKFGESDKSTIRGEALSSEGILESAQGFYSPRTEYRRTGEDTRGISPRQSEPHLVSSTFALSGDSAHNQAMVHWSGHNSSVSSRIKMYRITDFTNTFYMPLMYGLILF